MADQVKVPEEWQAVGETNEKLLSLSQSLMGEYRNAEMALTASGFSCEGRLFLTATAEAERIKRRVNEVIKSHQIKCPHCDQVNRVDRWKLVRGHNDEESVVAGCPYCRENWNFDGDYGSSIKTILLRAYVPPEKIFTATRESGWSPPLL